MTAWTIEQMREVVERRQAIVVGGSYDAVCDWLELPETGEHPSQETVPEPQGVLVDVLTANAIVTVYDHLSEVSRERFLAIPVETAGVFAWKLTTLRRAQ